MFVLGIIPFLFIMASFIYPLFRIMGVIGRDDRWSFWCFLIYIPIAALLMTFGGKLMSLMSRAWDKADDLTKKVKD